MDTNNQLEQETQEPLAEQILQTTPLKANKKPRKILLFAIIGVAVICAVIAGWFITKNDSSDEQSDSQSNETVSSINSFADCVSQGNPIQESYPERCITADGKTFTNPEQQAQEPIASDVAESSCEDDETMFQDKTFGAQFCYPTDWGTASVMDAKIDAGDTGHREAVRFSATTKFIVGGVSEDWTTTVGRDVGCQEPSNRLAEIADYDTEWHDIVGEGMAVEFAVRSIEVVDGGYDISEEVSNLLSSGVCARGHKQINGSRYKVLSAAFYTDFSESAGISTPKAHMDNPTVLFSSSERQQLDRVLSSAQSY